MGERLLKRCSEVKEMRKIVLFILVFLLLVPHANAQEITNYKADIEVATESALQQEISLTIFNNHDNVLTELSYPFMGEVRTLGVYDSFGDLDFSSAYKGGKTYISCVFRKPLPPRENYTIAYKFISPGQVWRREDRYILQTTHLLLANVKNFELLITLPEGHGLTQVGASPKPGSVSSDGRRVMLEWSVREPIPSELREFKIILEYEQLLRFNYYYILLGVIPLALIFAYRYLREEGISLTDFLDRKKYLIDRIEILKEDEQTILKLIVEQDGIDQREIQRKTGFSKTKVSKILSELEKRGNIRKEPYGRRNKIFLTDKIK